jgi:hypothetical protein
MSCKRSAEEFKVAAAPVFGHQHPPGIDVPTIVKLEGVVTGTNWVNLHVVFWFVVCKGVIS